MSGSAILVAVSILTGVAAFFGLLIALANRKLKVWEDPRIEALGEMLPGSNCGACGQPGCRPFAEALVEGRVQPAECTSLSPEGIDDVAHYLGVEAGEIEKQVARLLCAGGRDVTLARAEYRGLDTCRAAAVVGGGGKACAWACLELGDCVRSCDFEAMFMTPAGLPAIIPERCTACGDCVEECPRDLLVLMPLSQKLIVQCLNLLEGDQAEAVCQVACTGCGLCAIDAAPGLIQMQDGLAVIDYTNNELAEPDATRRCPTGAIAWVEGTQLIQHAWSEAS